MSVRFFNKVMNDAPQASVLYAGAVLLKGRWSSPSSCSALRRMPNGGRRRRAEWDHGGRWQWRQHYSGRPLSRNALKHWLHLHLSAVCLSVCLSLYLSIDLSIYLSTYLSIYLS